MRVIYQYSDLAQVEWQFLFQVDNSDHFRLRATGYYEYARPTKRHKWRCRKYYSVYNRRDSNIERPEVPESVFEDAKREIIKQIEGIKSEGWL